MHRHLECYLLIWFEAVAMINKKVILFPPKDLLRSSNIHEQNGPFHRFFWSSVCVALLDFGYSIQNTPHTHIIITYVPHPQNNQLHQTR